MSDGYIQYSLPGGEPGCEFERTLRGEYCGEKGEVSLDGLRVCERHAERLRLQERVAYWRAILAHIQLWAGEAQRRGRDDVVDLLKVEQVRTSMALERASAALQRSQDGEDSKNGEDASGNGRALPSWWPRYSF